MNRKRIVQIIAIVAAAGLVVNVAALEGPSIFNKDVIFKFFQTSKPNPNVEKGSVAGVNDGLVQSQESTNADIKSIKVSKEEEDAIGNLDAQGKGKNINNYKRMIARLSVPDEYRKIVLGLMKKGYKMPQILAVYDFLNENYGNTMDLEELLAKAKGGMSLKDVFKSYTDQKGEFVPKNFAPGILEELMKDGTITPDDIMIADKVSQKGGNTFDGLVNARKKGKNWGEIKRSLGILNIEEKLPKLAVTKAALSNMMKSSKLSENQVLEALTLAKGMDSSQDEVLNDMKNGKNKAEIYEKALTARYK